MTFRVAYMEYNQHDGIRAPNYNCNKRALSRMEDGSEAKSPAFVSAY